MTIDYGFIEQLEGKKILRGYVPMNKKGQVIGRSGVTIATGFDLGQHYISDIENILTTCVFDINDQLISRLSKYATLKGQEAVQALKEYPLIITEQDAKYIDECVKGYKHLELMEDWDNHSFVKFLSLPDEAQTVLFSLAYNFGSKLSKSLPTTHSIFKKAAESRDYSSAYNWLMTFPGKNLELKNRRMREAAYLRPLMLKQRT